jgi:hypothetical protein
MAKLNVVFGAVTAPLRKGVGKVKSMIGGIGGMLMGVLASGLSLVALGIKDVVSAGARLEQTRVAFEVLLGSAEKANATIKQLRQFANVTPFDTNSVIEASRALIATGSAGKELGLEMRMAGDIASGTGKKIGDISAIYAKMKRLGRLTFEEINQLANSGAVTMDELHKATGKSERSFRRFVESGRADFSIIKKIFEDSTSAGGRFYQMTEKISRTAGGKFSTLVGKLQTFSASLGEETTAPIIRMIDAMIRGVDKVSKWESMFKSMAKAAEATALAVEVMTGSSISESFSREVAGGAMPGDSDVSRAGRGVFTGVLSKVMQGRMDKAFTPGSFTSLLGMSGTLASNIGAQNAVKSQEILAMDLKETNDILRETQRITAMGANTETPGGY